MSHNIQPPAEWASCDGLKGTDKVQLASHLNMYIKVSILFRPHEIKICVTGLSLSFLGRALGIYGAVELIRGIRRHKLSFQQVEEDIHP